MQNNRNFRPLMPQNATQQHRIRPSLNQLNNNPMGYGYSLPNPISHAGMNFRQQVPMFPSVYQHHLEDYQPYWEPNYMTYPTQQNQMWPDQNYYDQGLEGAQHFEMNIQPDHMINDFTSQHVHQQSARLTQRIPPTSNVRASTAAVKRRHTSFSGNQPRAVQPGYGKVRRLNPPMPLLPVPKPESTKHNKHSQSSRQIIPQAKTVQQKAQEKPQEIKKAQDKTPVKKEPPQPPQIKLFGVRFLLGSIPQLHKWSFVRHKDPPIYETVGTLVERLEFVVKDPHLGIHFSLCNLVQLRQNGSSMNELLECVIYNTDNYLDTFPAGMCIRVVGRFQSPGLLQCLKVREATESDIVHLTSKVMHQVAKVNVSQCSQRDSSPDQEQLQEPDEKEKEIENSFGAHYSIFTPF